jgi:hypothetical protein
MTHRVRSLLKIGVRQLGRTFADQPVIWKSAPLPGISVIRTVGSACNFTFVTVKYGTVLLIRICISADPDPDFYINADSDLWSQTKPMRIRMLARLCFLNKLNFCMKNILHM